MEDLPTPSPDQAVIDRLDQLESLILANDSRNALALLNLTAQLCQILEDVEKLQQIYSWPNGTFGPDLSGGAE